MKTHKITFLLLSVFAISLNSCSVEKRLHMKGYHVSWKQSVNHPKKLEQSALSGSAENRSKLNEANIVLNTDTANNQAEATFEDVEEGGKNRKKGHFFKENQEKDFNLQQEISEKPTKTVPKARNERFKDLKKVRNPLPQPGDGSGALTGFGVVFLVIGILVVIFVSILVGLLLVALGIVLIASGGSSSGNSAPAPETKKYVDVVYLKNGSMIRGIIVEQVPNETIKIQTKDGSIFVYKMEEVQKITKELE